MPLYVKGFLAVNGVVINAVPLYAKTKAPRARRDVQPGAFVLTQPLPLNRSAGLGGNGHDDRRGGIVSLHELDTVDLRFLLGLNRQVAELLVAQLEGELGFGDVDLTDVIREVDTVLERVILGGAVCIMQPDDHRGRTLGGGGEAPAAHAAQQVDCLGRGVAGYTDRLGHILGNVTVRAVEHDGVGHPIAARIDEQERHAECGLGRPVGEDHPLFEPLLVEEHALGAHNRRGLVERQRNILPLGGQELEQVGELFDRDRLLEPFRHERLG